MRVLVAGATGATGRRLVSDLLNRETSVRAIVRSKERIPESLRNHPNLDLIEGTLLDFTDGELERHIEGCEAIACCLGHNLTLKGVFGHPRKLVYDSIVRLCQAAEANGQPTKVVLMNTSGATNPDLGEKRSLSHRAVVGLIRLLLPPHRDNEAAAAYLRKTIGPNHSLISWSVVRPDGLIEEEYVSQYGVYPSPTRDPIFDPGKTSRINVGHFMAELITDAKLWERWKSQTPVIYNREINSQD